MTLMKKIKADQLVARKEQMAVKSALLTTLIGESGMIGKNDGNRETTDAEIVSVIKKFIKNNNETMIHLEEFPASYDYTKCVLENQILSDYLPKQLTREELESIINNHVALARNTHINKGTVMKWLKNAYDGQYDGKIAAEIVEKIL